jgi:predicted transcriptional regulator
MKAMEVHLNPDVQAKLTRMAAERGSDAEVLAREAIERFVDYDEWFIREVEKGLAAADRGELLSHSEVGARLEKRLTSKQPRA